MRVTIVRRRKGTLGCYWEYHCVIESGAGQPCGFLRRLVSTLEQLSCLMEVYRGN